MKLYSFLYESMSEWNERSFKGKNVGFCIGLLESRKVMENTWRVIE